MVKQRGKTETDRTDSGTGLSLKRVSRRSGVGLLIKVFKNFCKCCNFSAFSTFNPSSFRVPYFCQGIFIPVVDMS